MGHPLDDARAKLDRAKFHADALRADIRDAGQGEPYAIPLREEFDEDAGTLYLRVDRVTARSEVWGLLIGDALHNYRSALDNGWWQLACHHLRRIPTEDEAKQIQFPILRPGGTWHSGNYRHWVGHRAAGFVQKLQPDKAGYPADVIHPLAALRRFSNVDKHRNIHPTVERLHTLTFDIQFGDDYIAPDADAQSVVGTFHHFTEAPKAGDEVLTAPPGSVLHDPHVQFEAHQSGFVAIDGRWDLVMILDSLDEWVGFVLTGFAKVLAGEVPLVPTVRITARRP